MNFNINTIIRMALYVAVAFVGMLIWDAWMKDHAVKSNPVSEPVSNVPPSYSAASPSTSAAPQSETAPTVNLERPGAGPGKVIFVKTGLLEVGINLRGGNFADAQLLQYQESLENKAPMMILSSDPNSLYVAETGLKQSNANQVEDILYHTDQEKYLLPNDQNILTVKLTGQTASGLQITKTFTFERNKYNVKVDYELHNAGSAPWIGNIYQQIVRRNVPPKGSQHSRSYNGAAISSPDKPYQKLPFKKLDELRVDQNVQGGWVAMQQPYFLTAWIPPADQSNHYYSNAVHDVYTIGFVGPELKLEPKASASQSVMLYAGPEIPEYLKNLGKGLDLTIDYGWLWMFSKAIFWAMDHIHTFVKNWGLAIIITTLLIKVLFYKLSEKSYVSMSKMREIQPRLEALKQRFGDDKQGLSQATMEFYRKEKINPFGGCLPMIVQIPVFIALYYVLIESVQLRQAPFLWIQDLSIHDPYYILPILMGASMFLQQRLSPPPPDPTQAKMMMLLPVVFTVFFLNFPAGLVLYWLVNNCASILQQWYVMKTYKTK